MRQNKKFKTETKQRLKLLITKDIILKSVIFLDGGYVKYTFPLAASTTMLAWGLIDFEVKILYSFRVM